MPWQADIKNTFVVVSDPQQHIEIYADDRSSWTQILRIINPYPFCIKFNVISTNSSKYKLLDSTGVIKPDQYAAIVIEPKYLSPDAFDRLDEIRIQINSPRPNRRWASKDLTIVIKETKPREPSPAPEVQSFHKFEAGPCYRHQEQANLPGSSSGKNLLYFLFFCGLIVLLIPNAGEKTEWPEWLLQIIIRPTSEFKIFIAFALGYMIANFRNRNF